MLLQLLLPILRTERSSPSCPSNTSKIIPAGAESWPPRDVSLEPKGLLTSEDRLLPSAFLTLRIHEVTLKDARGSAADRRHPAYGTVIMVRRETDAAGDNQVTCAWNPTECNQTCPLS